MPKTIIIGGGINGLLLGGLLTKSGDEVIIFEKNKTVGGRSSVIEKEGFTIDNGVHFIRFGPYSALSKILKRIGVDIDFYKTGTSYVSDYDGTIKIFPTSPKDILKSTLFSFPEKIIMFSLLIKIKHGKYNEMQDISLDEWCRQNHISGGIRKYLELLSSSVMVCPFFDRVSCRELFRNINKILNTGHSAEYPASGWKSIYDTLSTIIKKNGSIFTGKKIDSLIFEKKNVRGVISGKKKYYADRVVITIPVQEIFQIIPPGKLHKDFIACCRNIVPTSGIFFDIALNRKISSINGWMYSLSPMAFGIITSNVCPWIAPENSQLLTMLYPVSRDDIHNKDFVRRKKNQLWGVIRNYFPDIEKYIIFSREIILEIIDGVQISIDQTEEFRPGPVVPGIENLYLTGDTISAPGAGGDVGNEAVIRTFEAMTSQKF
ncbi:MAG TPA: FAD-dependent oxidoreductase [Spirochaetota bacterium]|nr:FAD-dependent oxidoreductase [Spirochaetota bacterium]HPQ51658.1 FAD-dependent oxidoreductase [Spirochaetota bacterium]